jgi:1,2-phenylacetyl-CoA epoxidase catalytic subunit
MNTEEKKELLSDFLNQCWSRHIYLFEEVSSDYNYTEQKYCLQDDQEIIAWYLRNNT